MTHPTTPPASPDPRRAAYELVLAGVAAGLPIPDEVRIPSDNTIFAVFASNTGDLAAAEGWAAWLGLPAPAYGEVMRGASRPFRNYGTTGEHPAMPGWKVDVDCFCDVAKVTR